MPEWNQEFHPWEWRWLRQRKSFRDSIKLIQAAHTTSPINVKIPTSCGSYQKVSCRRAFPASAKLAEAALIAIPSTGQQGRDIEIGCLVHGRIRFGRGDIRHPGFRTADKSVTTECDRHRRLYPRRQVRRFPAAHAVSDRFSPSVSRHFCTKSVTRA